MTEQNNSNQEGQKTIVAFVVGLLIGGLIVWMFAGSPADAPTESEEVDTQTEEMNEEETSEEMNEGPAAVEDTSSEAPMMEIGDGAVTVSDQSASTVVVLDSVTYPMAEGWIGVREYNNDRLGNILGVVRFSESEGLVPEEIVLQRSTAPGNEYAVVFYTASDVGGFNLANNVQAGGVFATFAAE